MKRRTFERHLRQHGAQAIDEGANHTKWRAPTGGRSVVPRHNEIGRARTKIARLSPGIGDAVQAPAAFVRVEGLDVQRLEQRYVRIPDESHGPSFDYEAPVFAFACRIDYDASGLVVSYPEIAERIA